MAWLRKRRIKGQSRTYYICVTRDRHELAAGKDLQTARRVVAHYDALEQMQRHGVPMPLRSSWTLKRLQEWDAAQSSDLSRARRWRMLLAGFGEGVYLDEITPKAIELFRRRRLDSGAGPATVNRDCSVLSSALKRVRHVEGASVGTPFVEVSPLPERHLRKKPVSLPPRQVAKFITAAWALAADPPRHVEPQEWRDNAVMIELLYLTASRVSQILRLRSDQVRGGHLYFAGHKRGADRQFKLRGRLALILGKRTGEWVFPSRQGGPRRGFRRFWAKVVKRAGVGPLTPHSLRHSASSAHFAAGAMIPDVQRLLGHKSPAMAIALYTQLFPQELAPVEYHVISARRVRRGASGRGRVRGRTA